MRPQILLRRIHSWASLPVALPLLIILTTGVLLQLKKELAWVQPAEQRGTGASDELSLGDLLDAARSAPEAGIEGWDDVYRVEVRPARGIAKVVTRDRWEIQIDATTGDVLQVARRRSDLIESIHDGSWFHPAIKLGVFLPAAILALLLLATGLYLFFLPIVVRRRNRRRRAPS